MTASTSILRIAVPAPLRRCFDYAACDDAIALRPGIRVRVPFGRRELVGFLVDVAQQTAITRERLKQVVRVLDEEPVLPPDLFALLQWAADYYHYPLGEVLKAALPASLRQGRDLTLAQPSVWQITAEGQAVIGDPPARAPLQKKILTALAHAPDGLDAAALAQLSPGWRAAARQLEAKAWIRTQPRNVEAPGRGVIAPSPTLSAAQQSAAAAVSGALGSYQSFLLHGITGSGKTEVYLNVIEKVVACGQQALVLVPEIGLTPQLVARVRARFGMPVAVLHSGMSDHERLSAWLAARDGQASIVIGTRSAVFAPLCSPGVIVVDEEHDPSYKQQDGFRYHARDVAVMRAHRLAIPIVLGSATPSLDTLQHVQSGKYKQLDLPDRAGSAVLPEIHLLDLRRLPLTDGLSPPLVEQLGQRLAAGEQSLLFINRRGYAPLYMCHDCGWFAPCQRCDARLTLHSHSQRLRCHHCGGEGVLPATCPECGAANLHALGEGTERVESALARLFPRARIVRVDRDSTRRKGALEMTLRRIDRGEADILVGTQMLSKGHDFPNVTLVGVLNADQRLYSVDFRASEQLVQQIIQVSGRAGRGAKPGTVWIQTFHPGDPVFSALRRHDYLGFARHALAERSAARYPPFVYFALLRAESPQPQAALRFVQVAHRLGQHFPRDAEVELMDPLPAPMERRAGRYRAQLLIQAGQRRALHRFLSDWLTRLEETPVGKRVRWSLDVDPIDMH
jgi:primosomal protein N' (replication factor Y)